MGEISLPIEKLVEDPILGHSTLTGSNHGGGCTGGFAAAQPPAILLIPFGDSSQHQSLKMSNFHFEKALDIFEKALDIRFALHQDAATKNVDKSHPVSLPASSNVHKPERQRRIVHAERD